MSKEEKQWLKDDKNNIIVYVDTTQMFCRKEDFTIPSNIYNKCVFNNKNSIIPSESLKGKGYVKVENKKYVIDINQIKEILQGKNRAFIIKKSSDADNFIVKETLNKLLNSNNNYYDKLLKEAFLDRPIFWALELFTIKGDDFFKDIDFKNDYTKLLPDNYIILDKDIEPTSK